MLSEELGNPVMNVDEPFTHSRGVIAGAAHHESKMVNPIEQKTAVVFRWAGERRWLVSMRFNHRVPMVRVYALSDSSHCMDPPSITFCGRQVPADGFRFWVVRLVRWAALSKIDLGNCCKKILGSARHYCWSSQSNQDTWCLKQKTRENSHTKEPAVRILNIKISPACTIWPNMTIRCKWFHHWIVSNRFAILPIWHSDPDCPILLSISLWVKSAHQSLKYPIHLGYWLFAVLVPREVLKTVFRVGVNDFKHISCYKM